MMKCCLSVILILVLLNVSSGGKSQDHIVQHQYRFNQKTVDDGLSNNRVSAIYQDQRGFVWFGTYNGLDRFDGRNIKNFKHDPSIEGTISGNDIRAIFSDSRGVLWVGGNGGLDYLDLAHDQFLAFHHEDLTGSIGRVDAIREDGAKNLWIASTRGLFRYNLDTHELYQMPQADNAINTMPSGQISRILIDRNDNLWISIYQKSLCYYDQKTKSIECYSHDSRDAKSLSDNQIERMYEDREGNVWFGTMNNGLNRFNPNTRDFTRIIPDEKDSYSLRVRAIFEDLEGNFFIGTRGGVYMRDPGTGKFFIYASSEHPFSTLSQNSIQCSYIDATGSLWIGTFAGGVNYTNIRRKPFVHYSYKADNPYFLSSPNVYAFCEDNRNNFWIGTDNGLNQLDRNTGHFKTYLNNPQDPGTLSYNDVKSLTSDANGNIWVGTNQGGLNFYNRSTGRFRAYKHNKDDKGSISTDKVYGLLLDHNEDLWVLNGVGYLDILRKGSNTFEHTDIKPHFGIIKGRNNNLWIGGTKSIYSYDYNSQTFKEFRQDSLLADVYTLMEASNGELWIGGETGIVIYHPDINSFESLNVQSEALNVVYGIKEDRSHNIWISTEEGLVRLSNALGEKDKIDLRVYTKHDGLQSKQFNYNAHYQANSGEMMFGGINGFNVFNPSQIVKNDIPPFVAFTDLKVFNKLVPIGEPINGNVILDESIATTDQLEFNRHQSSFTIDFVGLHYAQSDANQYRYKLEGYDEDWTYTTSGRNFAPYSNLPGGEYTFLVNSANVDGTWAASDLKLTINIIPPFWNTWTFRILMIALIFGGVVTYFRWGTTQERERQRILEEKVNEATGTVKLQNEVLQEQSELLQNAILETNEVVKEAVESGNFSARIDVSNKKGEWKSLGESINNLFESVAKPFSSINEVVNKLAMGDLTGRYEGIAKGDIQRLTDNLNKAIFNLSSLLGEITERAKWLKESSSEMLNSGEQMRISTGEIASAIGEMSHGAHEQVRKIDESSGLIEGVLASSNRMGDQADSIQNTAKQGAEKSRSGIELVQNLDGTMKKILKSSTKTNEAVTSLTNRSKEISAVLRIIKDIASQTNLLALNAAIEAAQAGDSGRRFAVVAEEIRKLAESSKISTGEIEELVSAVQRDTSSTAELISEMSTSIKEGEKATSYSLSTFEEIYQYYQQTLDKSEMIVNATKQQTADIRDVVNIIAGVVVISEETAAGTEQTASSSAELSAGMQNYQDKSEQVSEIADELQAKVSQFRL